MQPADIHPSHDVREEGYFVSDPVCQKCRRGVYDDDPRHLLIPCEGQQTELFK